MHRRTFFATAASAAVLSLCFSGCDGGLGPMGSVAGKLTMDGSSLPPGTKVLFMEPQVGYAGFGLTDAEGNYTIELRREGNTYDALPVGQYEVMVIPADYVDIDDLSADQMLDGTPQAPPSQSKIPAKYMRASTSGLRFQVSEGENAIDIDLTSE